MITVEIAKSRIFNNKDFPTEIYTFFCPSCDYKVVQFDCEMTPYQCKLCEKPLQDIRGILHDPAVRVTWHVSEKQFWEQGER